MDNKKGETFIKRRGENVIIGFDDYRLNCRILRSKQSSWKNRRPRKSSRDN